MVTITNETVSHAIDYILEHIGEELSVEDVAAHCHFSKYYFSRMFKEQTGEGVYAFIRRMKVEQSAFRLKVEPKRSVTDIGYAFGYSPSNYSWLFRQKYQTIFTVWLPQTAYVLDNRSGFDIYRMVDEK